MSAYHHGLQSDHRFQFASKTAHKVGDAFEVSSGPNVTGCLASLLLIALCAAGLGFAGYMAVWAVSWAVSWIGGML